MMNGFDEIVETEQKNIGTKKRSLTCRLLIKFLFKKILATVVQRDRVYSKP